MKTARALVIILVVVGLLAAVTVGGFAYYTVRRPLPKQAGEVRVPGARDGITIYRDGWGVPHIYAATAYDLFFAQGFVHAQDRWWQMDVGRHLGRGTLSELLGENEAVQQTDRLVRALGWPEIARAGWDAASPESRQTLMAYAAGVNAYIRERSPGELALEYTALDADEVSVTPWLPLDSLAWAVALHWQSGGNAIQEIEHALALTRVDEAMLVLAAPPALGDATPYHVPPGTDYSRLPLDDALAGLSLLGPSDPIESSGWAVSGARTASGRPLLAVAPGGPVQMPSPWYENSLFCVELSDACPYTVTGFSVPGLPAIINGHNDAIAWGFTTAWIDEQDVFIVQLDPDNPARYAWDGGWREMTVSDYRLSINGQDTPQPGTVYRTHLGPVIATSAPLLRRDQALVLGWTGYDAPTDLIASLLHLNRAQNWDAFRAALRAWGGAASNVLYADVEGNIGCQLAGRVPARADDHSGLLPVPVQDASGAWDGLLPFEALPSVYNPARGYLIAANQAIAPVEESARLSATWDTGNRAARIEARLLDHDAHTTETFAGIQADTFSAFAEAMLPYLLELKFEDDALAELRDWLAGWDFRFSVDSPQAALFGDFWLRLVEFTYGDELGVLPCDCAATRQGMLRLLEQANHPWWDDVQTRFVVERRDAMLRRAFERAVIDLTRTLDGSRDEWRWGDLHQARFTSLPASRIAVDLIREQFERGPVPLSGSGDTINATRSAAVPDARYTVASAPAARLIIDLDNFESSRAIHMTGQSSHLASQHYGDMIDPWRFVEYHALLWQRTSIEESAQAILTLEPIRPIDDGNAAPRPPF